MTPRIMIAGTASGCGKTTAVCAVLAALVNRGVKAAAFKCGPDYIDPMFHSRIIGTPSYNLDGYFMDKETLRELLFGHTRGMDIAVLEGVMGYYDGLGMEDTASSYAVARDTGTPVILVVPCRGMGKSVQAVIDGYVQFRSNSNIKGIFFWQLAPSLYPAMKEYCAQKHIRALGYFPYIKEAQIESRHLGLITADEVADLKEKVQLLAKAAEEYLDFDGILDLACTATGLTDLEHKSPEFLREGQNASGKKRVRIAVARDRAFCFYYEDNFALLQALGCELVPFSPLADRALPKELDGLILGGGYPELYVRALEQNHAMRNAVRAEIANGIPTYAECGGFLYLHRELTAPDGTRGEMAGVFDGSCVFTKKLQHFGYVELEALKDNVLCEAGGRIRAHEFHRCVSDLCADTFREVKGDKAWTGFVSTENVLAGFPHLHYAANPQFAVHFVDKCAQFQDKRGKQATCTDIRQSPLS